MDRELLAEKIWLLLEAMMKNYRKKLFPVIILSNLLCLCVINSEANEATVDLGDSRMGNYYTKGNYLGKTLYVSFLKKGYRLEKRAEQQPNLPHSGATPYEMDVRCFLIKDRKIVRRIDSLNDLRGYVAIDSKEKAKEYVRLRTSDDVYFLFRPSILVEVYRREKEKLEENWTIGSASPAFFEKFKLKEIEIVKKGEYYEIKRDLLYTPWPGADDYPSEPKVFRVIEKVYLDGRYHLKKKIYLRGINFNDIVYPLIPS